MGIEMERPRIIVIILWWTNSVPIPPVGLVIGVKPFEIEVDLILVMFLSSNFQKSVNYKTEEYPVLVLKRESEEMSKPTADLILLDLGKGVPDQMAVVMK